MVVSYFFEGEGTALRVLSFLLFMIMFSSTLYMNYSILRLVSVAFIAALLFSFLLSKNELKFKFNLQVLLIVFLFSITSMVSAILNSDTELMMGALILLLIFITFIVILPSLAEDKSNELIYKSILYSHIPIVLFPLINGIGSPPYSGIFENPNSFGIACVTLFAVVVSRFAYSLYGYIFYDDRFSKRQLIIYFIGLPFILMLTIYSGSRTSFLTALAILLTTLGLIFLSFLRRSTKRQLLKAIRLSIVGFVVIIVVFIIFPIQEKFEQIVLYKFQLKSSDTLSQRGFTWDTTIEHSNMFGHGRDYFSKFEHAAHNTFISLLGQYGWLPTAFFILLVTFFLFVALRYSFIASGDIYKYLPILMMVSFIMLSMGEGMLFKGTMIGAFASAGATTILIKKQNVVKREIKKKENDNKSKRKFRKIVWQ